MSLFWIPQPNLVVPWHIVGSFSQLAGSPFLVVCAASPLPPTIPTLPQLSCLLCPSTGCSQLSVSLPQRSCGASLSVLCCVLALGRPAVTGHHGLNAERTNRLPVTLQVGHWELTEWRLLLGPRLLPGPSQALGTPAPNGFVPDLKPQGE